MTKKWAPFLSIGARRPAKRESPSRASCATSSTISTKSTGLTPMALVLAERRWASQERTMPRGLADFGQLVRASPTRAATSMLMGQT